MTQFYVIYAHAHTHTHTFFLYIKTFTDELIPHPDYVPSITLNDFSSS